MESKILSIENAVTCRVEERLNRFVVKVKRHGNYYRAHINNTGRLSQFLIPGRQGFCVSNEGRGKTDYRLFAIREDSLGAIIDTQLQMRIFEESLEMELIPWLRGYRVLRRNAKLGSSLIDYLLGSGDKQIYLEVKSAVLREGYYAMYPDCPSLRGRRHIRELTRHLKAGGEAIILFIAALPQVTAFKPNKAADPELYEALAEAQRTGVPIKSIAMFYKPEDASIYLSHPHLRIDFS